MTADLEVRARRRKEELEKRGIAVSLDEILRNLSERDHIDSTRKVGPLKQAEDAIVIDTTHMVVPDQVEQVCALANELIYGTQLKQ